METKVIVVVGAGPGVGASVARRFGREGYDIGLVARSPETLERLESDLRAAGVTATSAPVDITDQAGLTGAVEGLAARLGHIDVQHFNPSAFRQRTPLTRNVAELLEDVALGVGALLTSVQAARPFMGEGGRITVSASVVNGEAVVSVTDTGVGIAPEHHDVVFEEFRQVGHADKKAEGTGLGLALCRKFVELHGGRISLASEPGTGSTFRFTIPVAARS